MPPAEGRGHPPGWLRSCGQGIRRHQAPGRTRDFAAAKSLREKRPRGIIGGSAPSNWAEGGHTTGEGVPILHQCLRSVSGAGSRGKWCWFPYLLEQASFHRGCLRRWNAQKAEMRGRLRHYFGTCSGPVGSWHHVIREPAPFTSGTSLA